MIPRRRGQGLGLALLAVQVMNIGVENIPPVTLGTVAAQVAIFLQIGDLSRWFPSANTVCISAYRVIERKEWQTLILGALFHADDIHLYYNMASMLWKGRQLERQFKSFYFAYLLMVFTVLTSVIYVGLNIALSHLLQDRWYTMTCAVGFSGVLFALKVLMSHYSDPGVHRLLGFIPVSSKVVYWAELVVIQMITPNASFTDSQKECENYDLTTTAETTDSENSDGGNDGKERKKKRQPKRKKYPDFITNEEDINNASTGNQLEKGNRTPQCSPTMSTEKSRPELPRPPPGLCHLAGILVGLLYIKGPLKMVMDSVLAPEPQFRHTAGATGYRQSYTGRNHNNYYSHTSQPTAPPPRNDYERYTGGLSEEEQIRRATDESLRDDHTSRLYPDLDSLRARRQQRFQ